MPFRKSSKKKKKPTIRVASLLCSNCSIGPHRFVVVKFTDEHQI